MLNSIRPMGGFWLPDRKIRIPNLFVEEGRTSINKMIWQGGVADVVLGGNFFMGLCGEAGVGPQATLVSISDELTVTNGYIRTAFTRDATGVPTIDVINGQAHIRSKVITFTAAGGNFSGPYSRIFLCNVVSGSSGVLFSFSAKIDPPVQVSDTESQNIQYDFYY